MKTLLTSLNLRKYGRYKGLYVELLLDTTHLEVHEINDFESHLFRILQEYVRIVHENAIIVAGGMNDWPDFQKRGWESLFFFYVSFSDVADGRLAVEDLRDYCEAFPESVAITSYEYTKDNEVKDREDIYLPGTKDHPGVAVGYP